MGAPLIMSVALVLGPDARADPGDDRRRAGYAVCMGDLRARRRHQVTDQRNFDVDSLNDPSGASSHHAGRAWQLCHYHGDVRHRRYRASISRRCDGDRALN